MDVASFTEKFGKKPIFGMIHLAGKDPVKRALEELTLFQEEGITGALVENYHNSSSVVREVFESLPSDLSLYLGVNILPNEFDQAFTLADRYGLKFMQLDHVAGHYLSGTLDVSAYMTARNKVSTACVFGGVWPKYYRPIAHSSLEHDVREGMQRADALVVTGSGTGQETPIEKIQHFRILVDTTYPLIVGAGLTPDNVSEQLVLADGGIVGSSLKINNNTENPVDRQKVRDFMAAVKEVRNL